MVVVTIYFNSCCIIGVDKDHDYNYYVHIDNQTKDTLILALKDSVIHDWSDLLLPNDTSRVSSGAFNEGSEAIDEFFESCNIASLFRNDSLKIIWEGPGFEASGSVYHFYNYNCWQIEYFDDNGYLYYRLYFTITDDDLK